MIRQMQSAIAKSLANVRQAFRGRLSALDRSAPVQLGQVGALAGETLQAAELFQQFGFTSAPPAGTQVIVLPLGGRTNHSVIIATENGALRVDDLASGEVCIYDQSGSRITLRQNRLVEVECRELAITASERVTVRTPAFAVRSLEGSNNAVATFDGTLWTHGDLVAGTTSLRQHTHPGDSGGTTGTPNPGSGSTPEW